MKTFLADVLMTGTDFQVNSNCFVTVGEEPSPTSSTFSFDALGDFLVVSFLKGIVPTNETILQGRYTEKYGITMYI
jgi:hypothetical protein